MGLFSRKSRSKQAAQAAPGARDAKAETVAHLTAFVASHTGCEAFIEPPTRVTQTTMVIVADTGEWTRRRVPDDATARRLAKQFKVPAFDVNLSGYPSRMREWNEKHRKGLG
ncbi:oxidoreductase [Demequina sp.]|uniref:oxidoreductase n=1 Tax=Demequina sp. TaxID=2050685 RepID=UPI0025F5CE36|nr:oxidoreductase [Demequina sp.]